MALPGKGILIVVENLPVPFDRRVWMEATTLRKAGYEVAVICPMGKGYTLEHEVIEGIRVYRHPLPPDISSVRGYLNEYSAALRWEWRLARRAFRESPFQLVHICNPPDLLFLVALWFKLLHGTRVIYDQHDLNPEMYEAKYGRRDLFYYGLRVAEWLTYRISNVVIATNESHRETAVVRGRKAERDVFIVRSGPDLGRFTPAPRSDAYHNGRKYLVGYVGVMGEPEGIDVLLHAVHHLVHSMHRTDIQFGLIGGGPRFDALVALRDQLGLQDFVDFTGRIPDAEMIARLSSCDICVAPDIKSPYNDKCTMNKVLEYMALGKPVIQFDLVEGRRSAADASTYVADTSPQAFATEIARLLDSPEARERMAGIGTRRMRDELEWKHQTPRLLAAYQRAFD